MRRALAALLLLALAAPARAGGSSAVGTTSAGFLKLGVGGRAAGMAEAYSAVVDDADALAWNPAALTRIKRHSATFMHAAYVDSSLFDYAAYARSLAGTDVPGALGIGVTYFSAGAVTGRDVSGLETDRFTPQDLAVMVGYALDYKGTAFGASWKVIRSTLEKTSKTAAFDFGVLSPALAKGRVRLAFTAANVGGGTLRFDQEEEKLPVSLRLGSAYQVRPRWRLALDGVFPLDNAPYAAAGTEHIFRAASGWELAARAGLNTLSMGDVDGLAGVTVGFGAGMRGFRVDYGFVPLGKLDLTHRLSFSVNF